MNKNPSVDAYIATLPQWQQALCAQVREIIHEAVPGIAEEIKFKNRPYFTYHGSVCALLGTKDHVNIFIYDPTVPDPMRIINQGHGNTTARSIQVYENDSLHEKAFQAMIRAVAERNKNGGWRAIK